MLKLKNNFIVLIVSLVVSISTIEILLRFLPQQVAKIDYAIPDDERIYTPSKYVKFKPNFTRVWTGLGPPTIWHFNNLGFRERNISLDKPENIFRIAVIGDSIVMGFGVEDFEAFPRRLELALKSKVVSPEVTHMEVLNLGIQGYSTPQYLAVLREDAIKLRPDLVIIVIYPSNDLTGAVGFWKNKTYTNLMSIPDFIPYPINEFLKRKSRLYLFLLTKYYTFVQKYESNSKPTPDWDEEGWKLFKKDLESIKREAENNHLKVVLVPIPKPKEVFDESPPSYQGRFDSIAKELGFIYYDPFSDLKKYGNIRELYMDELDDHFSPRGNEYIASILAKFLLENELIPEQPEDK